MRVLFYNDLHDYNLGSSIRQMYQEARCLRARGHDTAVVSCTQDPNAPDEIEVDGCRVFLIHSDYPVRFRAWVSLDNPRVKAPLALILRDWKPDVVHSHLIHAHLGYASLTAAKEAGAGVVFTSHDAMTFCYQKLTCFHGGEAAGGLERDYLARASKCIPCQRFRFRPGRNRVIRKVLARDVHRFTVVSDELGVVCRANDIRVDRTIYNAIPLDESPAESEERADQFRKQHGLVGKQVLAIGGRLHSQKGVGKLLEMIALLAPDFPGLRLIVMGKRNVYDQEFEPLARALGIADRVVPTGWLSGDELESAYAATDVFVTPSICFDTFGLVNLEAMRYGKPVVASCYGGLPEVVIDGETGFIENPFDVPAYANRLRALLEDPELARRLGEAGALRLRSQFGIERLTEEFLEEYELAIEAAQKG